MKTLLKTKNKLVEYFCSDYFIATLAIFTVAFWAFGLEIVGAALFVGFACIYLWLGSDLRPVLTIIMFITMIFSLEQISTPQFMTLVKIVVPAILVSFAYNLIHFRKERHYRKGKLFYGMLVAYLATLLSGITYVGYNKIWTLAVIGVGLGVYFVYFLCINCIKDNLGIRICKILFFAGLIVSAQTIIWFLRQPNFMDALLSKELRVGWGMSNTMAVMLVMAVPAVVWLGVKNKTYSYIMFPASALFGVMLILTLSRGNILFGIPIMLAALIYGLIKAKSKMGARISAAATVAAAVIMMISLPLSNVIIDKLLNGNVQGFFDPNGRIRLYTQAIKNFFESPIFGVGYFKPDGFGLNGDGPAVTFLWKTHNTVLQILSCSGIVGLLGMVPYYVQRYWMLFTKFSGLKLISLLAVLAYELEGMVDLTFLSVHQLFFVFGLLAAAENESYNKKRKEEFSDLSNNNTLFDRIKLRS